MYIAIDIGGTNTRIGSFKELDPSSEVGYKKIPTNQNYKKGLKSIQNTINNLVSNEKIDSIGISIASGISEEGNTIVNPNIAEWKAEELFLDLKSALQTNIKIINDGAAGGIAEASMGAGKNLDYFTFLTWGTGLGGVTIKKSGKVLNIYEYEPGHLKIRGGGHKCECGEIDCIEGYVGGLAVEKRLKKRMSALTDKEWDEILDYMRVGINRILAEHPVNNIIFDGKVIIEHPNFVKKLESMVNNNYPAWVSFEQSSVGDEAPLYGALMALNKDLDITFRKEF